MAGSCRRLHSSWGLGIRLLNGTIEMLRAYLPARYFTLNTALYRLV